MTEPIRARSRPGAMLRRLLAILAFASLITVAAPTATVFACSCMQFTPATALANADVAFVGVVAAIDDPGSGPLVNSGEMLSYTFAIEQTLKGAPEVSLTIGAVRSSASCGQEFASAQRWRIFAVVDEAGTGDLVTGLCSGNELLAENAPLPPVNSAPVPTALLLAIGAGIVLAGISALAFMSRGSKASA